MSHTSMKNNPTKYGNSFIVFHKKIIYFAYYVPIPLWSTSKKEEVLNSLEYFIFMMF